MSNDPTTQRAARGKRPSVDTPPRKPYTDADRDAERARQRMDARIGELRASHWVVRVCARGHEVETHRASYAGEVETARCPICGAPAGRETPEQTAVREYRREMAPLALVSRLADTISEWAHVHLHAESWTQRSEQQRAARERAAADRAEQGQYSPYDL